MGSAFHQLCPRYSGTLIPTAPTAIRLWEIFTFTLEVFSVKLGQLLIFLSLVLPFIKLLNNGPVYTLTSCLLSTEVDKGTKTCMHFVRHF